MTTLFPPVLSDDAFTLAAWVNPASGGGSGAAVAIEGLQQAVGSLGYDADAGGYCFIMAHADEAGAATTSACAAGGPQVGAWTHLVGVFDQRERQLLLYVDGQLAAEATYAGLETWAALGALSVGRTLVDGTPADHFHGRVALVRAYQGVLDATSVADLYLQQLDPTPSAVIITPTAGQWSAGQEISFSGQGIDLSGQLPVSSLTWVLSAYDCDDPADPGCEVEVLRAWSGTGSGSFITPDRVDPVNLRLELTADNGTGLLRVASVVLTPATVTLTFTADPVGLDLTVAGDTADSPVVLTTVQGATVAIDAPEPQEVSEVLYGFDSWSHGGTAAQQISAPVSDTTYTTTYLPLDLTPTAVINVPPADLTWVVGQQIDVAGHATDPTGAALPASALSWRVIAYRCVDEDACPGQLVADWSGSDQGSFIAPDLTHPAYLEVELTADNGPGWVDTVAVQLDPQLVDLTLTTDPTGLELSVDGTAAVTPFTMPAIQGSAVELSAPSTQDHEGQTYVFGSWAHGGAATHTITVPAAAITYTATYVVDETPTGAVTGTVFCDGTRTWGVTVTLAGLTTSTDINGDFVLEEVAVGEHTLFVAGTLLCGSRSVRVTVNQGEVTSLGEIHLCDPFTC